MRTLIALTAAMMSLSACATAIAPVNVTRFHDGLDSGPVSRGAISLQPENSNLENSLEYRTYATAVRQGLQRVGYTVNAGSVNGAGFPYKAFFTVTRDRRLPVENGGPVSVGVGGSTGSYGSGIGVGIGLNLSGKPKEIIITELFVRIVESESGEAVWEGRAMTEAKAGTPAAQPGLAAGRLAEALFEGFPGTSGETIRVK